MKIILTLLSHQWKSFIRSRNAGKSLIIQLFMALLILYFLAAAIILGISVGKILTELFPGQATVSLFCSFILYYFLMDIMLRFMLQDLPALAVQPYLTQNIEKKKLAGFLNIRSLFTVFNILPLVLFIPFSVTKIAAQYGNWVTFCFIINIVALTAGNHFFILFIKRKTFINYRWMIGFILIAGLFITGDRFHFFPVSSISARIFTGLLKYPWLTFNSLLWAAISFFTNYSFLQKNLYLEENNSGKSAASTANYSWLQRFGLTGELISIDVKMILRNKRPRTVLLISAMLLLYGFIFYKPEFINKGNFGFLLFGGIFITGVFIINYGQFLFAWQSGHFDGILTHNIGTKAYIKSKFALMLSVSTIWLLCSLAYGFISWKIIPVEIAAYLFNIGINTVLVGLFATRNYKSIDITKKASFNYQGMGATQWLYTLAIGVSCLLVYWPFAFFMNSWAGIAAIGVSGLVFLLFQDWWIGIIQLEFQKNKYKISEGFREN